MSAMAVSSGAAMKSTLNPNAPLFIPMALQQVEDFSPEWWELVNTTTWFREHWFHRNQDQETFDVNDEEDVANLLPDTIDLGIGDELSIIEAELDDAAFHQSVVAAEALKKGIIDYGFLNDEESVVRNLGLKSPKNAVRPILQSAKYWEKPAQRPNPMGSPRRMIQQPR
ncbi:protein EARLY RESPONSIVE TO DEHYDRATION 15 [Musa acuminata AAA Group]|uniref:protein EARLY RESPONSIVE TO DEHYDRATION 15 n=1 Tax=Musa acuminata AAA Group TaxID=214697 RepID=UPI0031D96056